MCVCSFENISLRLRLRYLFCSSVLTINSGLIDILRPFLFVFCLLFIWLQHKNKKVSEPWNFIAQESRKTFNHRDGPKTTTTHGGNRKVRLCQQVIQSSSSKKEKNQGQEGKWCGEPGKKCWHIMPWCTKKESTHAKISIFNNFLRSRGELFFKI